MFKHLVLLTITIAILQNVLYSQSEPSDNDNNGYINLKTTDHLIWLSNNPQSWDKDFELENDIDISDSKSLNLYNHDDDTSTPDIYLGWSPIGNQEIPFTGKFYGNNYTVKGLYINRSLQDDIGFFGYLSEAIVKNLNLETTVVHGNNHVGLIAGRTFTSEISECKVEGDVTGTDYVGGIVGKSKSDFIDCCESEINIDANRYVGGIGGLISSNLTIHGVVNSSSRGNIEAQEDIGGIAGSFEGLIASCFSFCQIKGNERLGGLVGTNHGLINNTFFRGSLDGKNRLGGIVGFNEGLVPHVANDIPAVYNSYAVCDINSTNMEVGGIVGRNYFGKIIDCLFNTDIIRNNKVENESTNEIEQLKSKEAYTNWNFSEIWNIDANTNDGFPFLRKYSVITSARIEDISANEKFTIYPIPAKNYFNISTDITEYSLFMVDNNFKTVLSTIDKPVKINTNNFSSGIYYIVFSYRNIIEVKKMIIIE